MLDPSLIITGIAGICVAISTIIDRLSGNTNMGYYYTYPYMYPTYQYYPQQQMIQQPMQQCTYDFSRRAIGMPVAQMYQPQMMQPMMIPMQQPVQYQSTYPWASNNQVMNYPPQYVQNYPNYPMQQQMGGCYVYPKVYDYDFDKRNRMITQQQQMNTMMMGNGYNGMTADAMYENAMRENVKRAWQNWDTRRYSMPINPPVMPQQMMNVPQPQMQQPMMNQLMMNQPMQQPPTWAHNVAVNTNHYPDMSRRDMGQPDQYPWSSNNMNNYQTSGWKPYDQLREWQAKEMRNALTDNGAFYHTNPNGGFNPYMVHQSPTPCTDPNFPALTALSNTGTPPELRFANPPTESALVEHARRHTDPLGRFFKEAPESFNSGESTKTNDVIIDDTDYSHVTFDMLLRNQALTYPKLSKEEFERVKKEVENPRPFAPGETPTIHIGGPQPVIPLTPEEERDKYEREYKLPQITEWAVHPENDPDPEVRKDWYRRHDKYIMSLAETSAEPLDVSGVWSDDDPTDNVSTPIETDTPIQDNSVQTETTEEAVEYTRETCPYKITADP